MTPVLADPHNLNVKIEPKIVGLYANIYGFHLLASIALQCYHIIGNEATTPSAWRNVGINLPFSSAGPEAANLPPPLAPPDLAIQADGAVLSSTALYCLSFCSPLYQQPTSTCSALALADTCAA